MPTTAGSEDGRSSRSEMRLLLVSGRRMRSRSSKILRRSRGDISIWPRSNSARTLRMVSAALELSRMISSTAAFSSARGGLFAARNRRAACALLEIAPSGWFS